MREYLEALHARLSKGEPYISYDEWTGQQPERSFPPLVEQAKNFAATMVQYVESGLQGISEEEYQHRLGICAACPDLQGVRCLQCGCFMKHKAKIGVAKCKIGKW